MTIEESLFNIKDNIQEAKADKNRQEGKLEELYKELKEVGGITNITTIENKLKKMKKSIRIKKEKLEKSVLKLEDEIYS